MHLPYLSRILVGEEPAVGGKCVKEKSGWVTRG